VDVPVPAEEGPAEPSWFAMVRGSQVGPMGLGPLEALIRAGEVTAKTFLWCEGMAEWRRAEGLPDLASLLAATRPPKPASTADLSQLFSDLDLTVSRPMEASAVEQMLAGKRRPQPVLRGSKTGRHQQHWEDDPAEDPRRFRRNPPWEVASAVLLAVAFPVAGLYALSTLRVVPLEVSRVDEATGARVQEPVFSAKGARGLKDLLLGRTSAAPAPAREPTRNPAHRSEAPRPEVASAKPASPPEPKPSAELKALYREGTKQDIGPPKLPAARAPTSPTGSGPDSSALSRVVAQSSPAFQFCIEQQLKKNPRFRGGKITLLATIGPSGVVKQARVDRKDIDGSDLGDCLKSRARRLVFPAFTGDDVEVQIPLVLTTTL
jgi:hypothetical protein